LLRRPPARVASGALEHVLAILRKQIDAIRGHEAGARLGTDPEVVHEMRTAVRLGEHQDAVVAKSRIGSCLRGVRSRPATDLRDRLIERQRARRRKARTAFWKKWSKLERRGRKVWT
jgi:CHAD domain-containing protein